MACTVSRTRSPSASSALRSQLTTSILGWTTMSPPRVGRQTLSSRMIRWSHCRRFTTPCTPLPWTLTPLAYQALQQALQIEIDIGLLLPCNVVVYEVEGGSVVEAFDVEFVLGLVENPGLMAAGRRHGNGCNRHWIASRADCGFPRNEWLQHHLPSFGVYFAPAMRRATPSCGMRPLKVAKCRRHTV